ncbi:enoyl-CoA hydratase/isomerase family protein [Prauserella muralis]|uniref:Enoyl-CoA hydratase n=1 Tax=Prauserella muralis TaxID=588067 RepID=A0A2V4AIG3_9PSEU|nr:enoyl-CoA hydratase/isomerase family protein [Prauserella muralis]PXY19350.1 enoyl-CoA hydratase [Prauserella muralis]TWE29308.1 enoyl-CoA hydratase [Prauserella muralis]
MSSIQVEPAENVAVLRMEHGKANALDTELCQELVTRLEEVEAGEYRAVVLTGTAGMFSAGVDLRRVRDGGARYVAEFLPALSDAFLALFDFSRPVVAAVNGHAIAGGAVLAAACDRRVMDSGHGRFGVTELLVGVPFPLAAMEILRCAYGTPTLPELTYLAHTHPGGDALARGLVDELAEPDSVLPRALELARTLAAIPAEAFAHTKHQIHRPFNERIGEQRANDDAFVERLWAAPETLRAVEAYVQSVLR